MLNWSTQSVKDGQATVILYDLLFAGLNTQRKLDFICLSNIFLIYNLDELCITPCYVTPRIYLINLVLPSLKYCNFGSHGNWDGKSSITIFLLLDCFAENKMTKLSERFTKYTILEPFWSKYKQK